MTTEDMVEAIALEDGRVYRRRPDGSLVPVADDTDWARIDALTDEEIEAAAEADADNPPLAEAELGRAKRPQPESVRVSARIDRDVLAWLRQHRGDDPRPINSALRALMDKTGTA